MVYSLSLTQNQKYHTAFVSVEPKLWNALPVRVQSLILNKIIIQENFWNMVKKETNLMALHLRSLDRLHKAIVWAKVCTRYVSSALINLCHGDLEKKNGV